MTNKNLSALNKLAKGLATLMVAAMWSFGMVAPSSADDTELFTQPPGSPQPPPNVLIYVDSSANWNANNQLWASGKQGAAELAQIKNAIGQLSGQNVSVGLMLSTGSTATGTSTKGGYIRLAARNLSVVSNVTNMQKAVDDIYGGNFGGSGGTGSNDQVSTSDADYSSVMYEVYNYFSSATSYSGVGATRRDFASNAAAYSAPTYGLTTGNAFASSGSTSYISPLSTIVPCAKNYLIFIGNGLPNADSSMPGGSSAKISSLQGGVVPAVIPISSSTSAQANWMDEWAKFLYSRGAAVPTAAGASVNGSIVTYTIDVYKAAQDLNQTALFKSAARVGGGRYFAATNDAAIAEALRSIFDEIQSVSSVFAAATLPVSVNVRGTNLNQVYLGVFRPDADAGPNWPGNLKEYKLGLTTSGDLQLVDSAGSVALSASTGFFQKSSVSFWTATNTYWAFNSDPTAFAPNSDGPDGPLVERGGVNQVMRWNTTTSATRLASDRKIYTYLGTGSPGSSVDLATTPSASFVSTNSGLTPGLFGLATTVDRDNVVNWMRGADLNDENGDTVFTDLRPRAHGDVIHSRPAVINYNRYGDDDDVGVFYGANDGLLHAIQGGQQSTLPSNRATGSPAGGGEYWAFAAAEFFTNFPRQYNNTPSISWSATPLSFTGNGYYASGNTQVSVYGVNSNIAAGQSVSGSGVPAGATVTASSVVNGVTISGAATATASGVAAQLTPPAATSAPITSAKLTLASNYVVLNGAAAPPTWLVSGMQLSGTGIVPGSTVASVVPTSGAALAGGAVASSANVNQYYTFSSTTPVSNTTVTGLMVVNNSVNAYRTAGPISSGTGEGYDANSMLSTLVGKLVAGSSVTSGASANAINLPSAPTGSPGALDSGVGLSFYNDAFLAVTTGAAVTCNTGSSCTISFKNPVTSAQIPKKGDRVKFDPASCPTWTAAGGPEVTSATMTGVTVSVGGALTCTLGNVKSFSVFPTYAITNAVVAAGVSTIPYSGTLTRGALPASFPTSGSNVLGSTSGTSKTGLSTGGVITQNTTTSIEVLSAAATENGYGNAYYQKTSSSTAVAVCKGDTLVNGTNIFNLGACTTGTVASIAPGYLVSGSGIPSNTTTIGVVDPGFSMSSPALATTLSGGGQSISAYYAWVVNTVKGAAQIQVSSPADLSLISNGWTVLAAGMPSNTTVVDKAAGSIQFATLSSALTGTSASGGSSLAFTNASAGSTNTGPKPYFFDGPIGVYRYDAPNTGTGVPLSGNGKIVAGECNTVNSTDCDQAIIYVPMRRGGRMIYAFDVTNPAAPKLLWKKGCTTPTGSASCDAGYEEMGQTWSIPQAYNYNIGGVITPLLVFGGGYDADFEDQDPVSGSRSMARSIMFVNAKTGVPVKVFRGTDSLVGLPLATTHVPSKMTAAQVFGAASLNCAVTSDVSVLTKDAVTGFVVAPFRAYVGDTCGQVWRLDTADTNVDNWVITRMASVGSEYYASAAGGSLTGNTLARQNRKFLFPPDVVYGGSDTSGAYHYILVGSGDREHPFNGYGDTYHPASQTVVNRFYMIKDYNINASYSASAPLLNPTTFMDGTFTRGASQSRNEVDLYDATLDLAQIGTPAEKATAADSLNKFAGWYITLQTGEKTVGGATASSNFVYFGTNKPATVSNACANNLGEARLYQVNIKNAGAAPTNANTNTPGTVTSVTERYTVLVGGGLPPTPVPVAVKIGGNFYEGVIAGTKVSTPSASVYGQRVRAYTRKLIDKN